MPVHFDVVELSSAPADLAAAQQHSVSAYFVPAATVPDRLLADGEPQPPVMDVASTNAPVGAQKEHAVVVAWIEEAGRGWS